MKTKIKQANWKSKGLFSDKKYVDVVTTVYWQSDDAFIDTDSKLLFQMVCEKFFYRYKNARLKLTLEGNTGIMFPEAYRLYVYNLIYEELTDTKIKNNILHSYQKRVLKIIKLLEIDFKKESKRLSRVLFKTSNKKDFHLSRKKFMKG